MLKKKVFATLKTRMSARAAMAEAAAKDSPGMVTIIETHLDEDVSVASRLLEAGALRHAQYREMYDIQARRIHRKHFGAETRRANCPS